MSSYGAETSPTRRGAKERTASTLPVSPVPEFRSDVRTLLSHQVRGVERALKVGNFAEFSVQGAGKTMTCSRHFRTLACQVVKLRDC